MVRIPCRIIELALVAAPNARSGETKSVADWRAANRALAAWAEEMPDEILSCDFKATFEDGYVYWGSIDFGRGREADLIAHVDRFMEVLLSDDPVRAPWRQAADPDGRLRAEMAEARERYDLGGSPEPEAPAFAK